MVPSTVARGRPGPGWVCRSMWGAGSPGWLAASAPYCAQWCPAPSGGLESVCDERHGPGPRPTWPCPTALTPQTRPDPALPSRVCPAAVLLSLRPWHQRPLCPSVCLLASRLPSAVSSWGRCSVAVCGTNVCDHLSGCPLWLEGAGCKSRQCPRGQCRSCPRSSPVPALSPRPVSPTAGQLALGDPGDFPIFCSLEKPSPVPCALHPCFLFS